MKEDLERRLGIGPGSSTPRQQHEIARVLLAVPEIARFAEFDACLFPAEELESAAALSKREQLERLASPERREIVRRSLDQLAERARSEANGGLHFLAVTLRHFLDTLPAPEHPLLVALFARSRLEIRGATASGEAIARELDSSDWGRS